MKTIKQNSSKVTPAQVRAARALLRWSAGDLAEYSKLGVATVRRAEASDDEMPITDANAETIKRTLEAAGVEFINEGAPGVRMKVRRRR